MIPEIYPQKRPKAILFDWDNTLVDTWRTVFEAINVARQAVDRLPFTLEEFSRRPPYSMRDTPLDLFGEHVEKGERAFYEFVEKSHLQTIRILEAADALLQALKKQGVYMGVVSNKDGPHLRREVEHLGWSAHFRRVIGARDTKEDKPSPIPVLAALQDSTILPSHDVWFVGDSIVDVHCARASGCVPIVVGQDEASQQNDVVRVHNCAGLMQLLARL